MAADTSDVEIVARANGIELSVKVVPGASRTAVAGRWGNALKVAVAAPAEGGKANAAVIKLLAKLFGVKKGDIELTSGHTRPLKRLSIRGLTADRARARLV